MIFITCSIFAGSNVKSPDVPGFIHCILLKTNADELSKPL